MTNARAARMAELKTDYPIIVGEQVLATNIRYHVSVMRLIVGFLADRLKTGVDLCFYDGVEINSCADQHEALECIADEFWMLLSEARRLDRELKKLGVAP